MRALLLAVLVLPASATAEPLATTREAAVVDGIEPAEVTLRPARLHLGWRAGATFAGSSIGAGSAGADAEAALSHGPHDLVVVGGAVDLRTGDAPLAAQQWGTIALLRGDTDYAISHHLAWDVRPTLLARPELRPGLNRRETVTIDFVGLRARLNDPGPLALVDPPDERLLFAKMQTRVGIGWTTGDVATMSDARVGADVGFIGYRRERWDDGEPLEVWVFAVDVDARFSEVEGEGDLMSMRFDPVRVSGARIGGARVAAHAGVGLHSMLGGTVEAPVMTDVVTIEPGVSIEDDLGGATYRLTAERAHWGLWYGALVVDDRLTLSGERTTGRVRLRFETFAARSHRVSLGGAIDRATTGGVVTLAETDVGRHAVLRVRSDLGRGFYAAEAEPAAVGAALAEPRWAAEVLATLSLRAGNR